MLTHFNNLSLGKKLYGLAAVLLAFLAIIGIVAIKNLGNVNEKSDLLYSKDTVSIANVGDLTDTLTDEQRLVVRGIAYSNDPAIQKDIDAKLAAADAKFTKSLTEYKAGNLTAKERSDIGGFEKSLEQFTALRGQVRQATTAGQLGTASALNKKLVAFYTGLHQGLVDTNVTSEKSAKALNDEITSTYKSGRNLTIVLLILALAFGAAAAFFITAAISKNVKTILNRLESLRGNCANELAAGLNSMAEGDLTHEVIPVTGLIDNPADDELGQIATAVNGIRNKFVEAIEAYGAMTEKLRVMVGELSATAGTVSSASTQMASTSEETGKAVGEIASAVGDVAQGAERQVRSIESVRSSADQTATAARTSADQAHEAAGVAEQARSTAQEGVEAAAQATEAMRAVRGSSQSVTEAIRELASKSDEIGAIVETITGIAGQTNLLALNAAIEAARAGEQGRGFAVVAEEVRKLAEESQKAAGEISSLVETIQHETGRAVEVVEDGAKRTDDGAAVVDQHADGVRGDRHGSRGRQRAHRPDRRCRRADLGRGREDAGRDLRRRGDRRAVVGVDRGGLGLDAADERVHAGDRSFGAGAGRKRFAARDAGGAVQGRVATRVRDGRGAVGGAHRHPPTALRPPG